MLAAKADQIKAIQARQAAKKGKAKSNLTLGKVLCLDLQVEIKALPSPFPAASRTYFMVRVSSGRV